jgi:hypothetical protein
MFGNFSVLKAFGCRGGYARSGSVSPLQSASVCLVMVFRAATHVVTIAGGFLRGGRRRVPNWAEVELARFCAGRSQTGRLR